MFNSELEERAASGLIDAGFLVQREVPVGEFGGRRFIADLILWKYSNNSLLLSAIVEVKSPGQRWQSGELKNQLLAYRNLSGAAEALVFDGTWWQVDELGDGFAAIERPSPTSLDGLPAKDDLIENALAREIRERLQEIVPHGRPTGGQLMEAIASLRQEQTNLTAQLQTAGTASERFAAAVAKVNDQLGYGETHSGTAMNKCLAGLARFTGGTVYDPFCGVGETLLLTAQSSPSTKVKIRGRDINVDVGAIATMITGASGFDAEINIGNSITEPISDFADVVVTSAPFGLRLPVPVTLVNGSTTRDGDLACVDVAIKALRNGGRAVLLVPPSFLFKEQKAALQYREDLAKLFRVVAVLRLPTGTLPGTRIASVILVIEKAAPTPTLFANVGEDWITQLAPGGALCEEYLKHLKAPE